MLVWGSGALRAPGSAGIGRRRYKQDYIRFLAYSLASCDETTDHLEALYETGSLADKELYERLHADLQVLGRKLNSFLQSVERSHNVPREDRGDDGTEEAHE